MRKSIMFALALGLAGLTGLGATASARDRDTRPRDFTGTWQLDTRQGDVSQDWGGGWDRSSGRDRNDGWNRGRERGSSYGQRGYDSIALLPQVIQIERNRRELRVENQRGRLLREISVARRDWLGNRLQVVTRAGAGQTVRETFALDRNGQRLVVRSVIDGPRGTREVTSIYQRA